MAATKSRAWNSATYDRIIAASGLPPDVNDGLRILKRGQAAALPKADRKTPEQIEALCKGGHAKTAFISAVERALANKPAPEPKLGGRAGSVHWTSREAALLVRRIEHWRSQGRFVEDRLGAALDEAQKIELPPDRRRTRTSLLASEAPSQRHLNKKLFDKGKAFVWTLAEPFDPDRTEWREPEVAAAPPPSPPVVEAPAAPPPPPDWTPTRLAALAAAYPTPGRAATPLGDAMARLGDAMHDLGNEQAARLDALIAQAQHVTQQQAGFAVMIEARLDGMAAQVVREMKAGIAAFIHEAIERELGGPVAAPAAPAAAPAPAPAAPVDDEVEVDVGDLMRRAAEANAARMREQTTPALCLPQEQAPQARAHQPVRVEIDVIGLFPRQAEQVRQAINGHADLRFFEPDHPQHWKPRGAPVFIAQKGAGGLAVERVRKSGVRPVVVTGGATSVIHAIEEMLGMREGGAL